MHDDHAHGGQELPMHGHSANQPGPGQAFDPVCGMIVEVAPAKASGLMAEHAGQEYFFCGRGCFLDFRDDPEHYFEPGYRPSM
jgi:Cu+-exporting ATPase